jgi:hypothetical protein
MVLGEEYSSLSYIGGCLGGLTHLSSICHRTKGGVKTGKVILIYKCNKYPERYIRVTTELTPTPKPQRLLLT